MAKIENSYEFMLDNLNAIVDNLENGDLTLEEAINKYEEGVKLINKLYKKSNTLEGKIKIVSNDVEKDAGDELNGYR